MEGDNKKKKTQETPPEEKGKVWLYACGKDCLEACQPFSDLIIPGSAHEATGRSLGSPMKIVSTAGYATKHIPSLNVRAHMMKVIRL